MTSLKTILAALAIGTAPTALGTPVFSVDLNPDQAGIQDSRSVVAGTRFSVQILLDTDGEEVSAFNLTLAPGGGLGFPIRATGIVVQPVFGTGPDETSVAEATLDDGTGNARAAAFALLGLPIAGSGIVLLSLDFLADMLGIVDLTLSNLLLFDEASVPIAGPMSADGRVTVANAVLSPTPLTLILTVLAPLLARSRGIRSRRTGSADGVAVL